MLDRLNDIILETCHQMECQLIKFNGKDDHIHLWRPSYFLRRKFKTELKNKLWGIHLCYPSYCAVSVGGATIEIVKKYIKNQKTPASASAARQSKLISSRLTHP
jgi:putative transposase